MRKSFQYRMYPTKKQETALNATLELCRELYNHLLEQRKLSWEREKKSLSFYDQTNTFRSLKNYSSALRDVYSQVLLEVAMRVDLAFKAFFRRIKHGEKPGYPRFCGRGRYTSFVYPQSGFKVKDNSIVLSKIGKICTILHRPTEGKIKTCTIKKTPTGKWFVSFSCELERQALPELSASIGIDAGLLSFITLSSGEKVDNPRFFKTEEKALARVQRRLSKQEKGSRERRRQRKVVALRHERIKNKRKDFTHKLSHGLVHAYGVIAIEDLNINNMQRDNFTCLNKSIADAAWRSFFDMLCYKAECAGRTVLKVNPAYTSQTCSRCGYRQKLKLSNRHFKCPCCALSLDRDTNAAQNILSLGLQTLGLTPVEALGSPRE